MRAFQFFFGGMVERRMMDGPVPGFKNILTIIFPFSRLYGNWRHKAHFDYFLGECYPGLSLKLDNKEVAMDKARPPLMTEEEWKELDRKISQLWKIIRKLERLQATEPSRKTAADLTRRQREKEKLENQLVERNIGLAIGKARAMFRMRNLDETILPDMEQHGKIGLMIASRRYNPRHKAKFSTYAMWWIRHEIKRFVAEEGVVRLSCGVHEQWLKLIGFQGRFIQKTGRFPYDDEILSGTGLSQDQLNNVREAENTQRIARLDRPISHGDPDTLGDLLVDKKSLEPFRKIEESSFRLEFWKSARKILTEKEFFVAFKHFREDQDLDTIAKALGIKRSKARNSLIVIVRKLKRHRPRFQRLT